MITDPEAWAQPRRLGQPTGLRAGSMPDFKLVGGAGPYEVDVLIRVLSTQAIEVIGQVTGGDLLHEPVSRLSLRLFDADALECKANTTTNHFGEFTLTGRRGDRYVLALGPEEDAPVMEIWDGGQHGADGQAPV